MSEKLVEQLKRHEGLRLEPYKCTAGKLTIGYGRNLESNGITEDEAEHMLRHDIIITSHKMSKRKELAFMCVTDDVRCDVLYNMAFNLGVDGLLKFKKMLEAMDRMDYVTAADEMLDSKWAQQVGERAKELSRQMLTGEYQCGT